MRIRQFFTSLGHLNENETLVHLREKLARPIVVAMSKVGITPNTLTFVGLFLGITAGILIGLGQFNWAILIFAISAFADLLDGPLARYLKEDGKLGAFMDSVFDRYVDIFVLGGFVWYFLSQDQEMISLLALITLAGTTVTSYAKARAESLVKTKRYVGLMNRPERVAMLWVGLIFPLAIPYIIGILAIMTNVTAIHRILFYSNTLQQPQLESK